MAAAARFAPLRQHFLAGRWPQARAEIDALAARQPRQAPAHWHRATALETLERHAEAVDAVERVLVPAPGDRPAMLKRGELADLDEREGLAGMEAGWIASSRAKAEYRRAIGFATDAELRALLGGRYDALAAKVRRKLALLAR